MFKLLRRCCDKTEVCEARAAALRNYSLCSKTKQIQAFSRIDQGVRNGKSIQIPCRHFRLHLLTSGECVVGSASHRFRIKVQQNLNCIHYKVLQVQVVVQVLQEHRPFILNDQLHQCFDSCISVLIHDGRSCIKTQGKNSSSKDAFKIFRSDLRFGHRAFRGLAMLGKMPVPACNNVLAHGSFLRNCGCATTVARTTRDPRSWKGSELFTSGPSSQAAVQNTT